MIKPKLTKDRIIAAYVIAAVADAIDVVVSAGEDATAALTGGIVFIPGEMASGGLDVIVGVAMTRLLGFDWIFVPSLILELIPNVDILPTWLGSVAYVVWKRKKEEAEVAKPATVLPVTDVHTLEVVSDLPTPRRVGPPPLPTPTGIPTRTPPPSEGAVEHRLKRLIDLHEKSLISHEEYEAKRQQILVEI
jgi:hypothetical protein